MNPPSARTQLLGNRFVAPLIMAGCAYTVYRWWEEGGHGILGILAIALLIACAKAMTSVASYRRWRADWEGMSPNPSRKPVRWSPAKVIALLGLAVASGVCCYGLQPDPSSELLGFGIFAVIGCLAFALALVVAGILWRLRPRTPRRQQPKPFVSVAIQTPMQSVATIREAYQRLPAYCHQLLKGKAR